MKLFVMGLSEKYILLTYQYIKCWWGCPVSIMHFYIETCFCHGCRFRMIINVLRCLACKAGHYTALEKNINDKSKIKCSHVVKPF
jgi:hypothetical protein